MVFNLLITLTVAVHLKPLGSLFEEQNPSRAENASQQVMPRGKKPGVQGIRGSQGEASWHQQGKGNAPRVTSMAREPRNATYG
jgi:hypothetical protein